MNTPSFQDVQFTNGYEFTQGTGYTLPEYAFVTPPELVGGRHLRSDIGLRLGQPGHQGGSLGRRQHRGS
ncbi:MAG: 3-(3-hydroxy-phenyl)propionate/3-hydroxycinnamic acid hydroxylase [Pseudomonadota bacterium]